MGFSGTESSGAQVGNGLSPQGQIARAKRQRSIDAINEARKHLESGSPKNCMDALHNAMNILANDYEIHKW